MSELLVESCRLAGILKITPATIFEDFRGSYVETYNEKLYRDAGIDVHFVQDDFSFSSQNVLRGIHGDSGTYKLITCPHGEFYLVVVDCDPDSENFGDWVSFILSEKNRHQVLVPPKHGLAHLITSEHAIFSYKQSTYYDRAGQFTYRFDDERFNIDWPISDPVLSERDALATG
ncbi:MAG: dTDP-4-dehydrorhamnose 3,5-epimerase family protein [Rhodospirillales bacterium]|nr:dTDP-4-dehydrorhamnose 3,5-epimerase family protein [Rhodospirillales bacterium]